MADRERHLGPRDAGGHGPSDRHRPVGWGPALLVGLGAALLLLLPAWVLIATGEYGGRGAFDQLNYHEPAIVRFAQQWPRMEFGNYLSATTPGYHVVLAAAAQVVGTERAVLQVLGSLFTGGLLVLLGASAARRVGVRVAAVMMLPLAGSMYLFFPGVWLLPDNAGWLGVVACLLIALSGRVGWKSLVAFACAFAALVMVRQVHLWTLGPALAAAYLGSRESEPNRREAWDVRGLVIGDFAGGMCRVGAVLVAAAFALIPFGALVWQWGGLTPPYFLRHQGLNPAAPAFVLAVFGVFAPAYAALAWRGVSRVAASNAPAIAFGVLVGCGSALAVPSSYDQSAGRWTGLWNLVKIGPEVMDRSIVLCVLAGIGGGLWMSVLGGLCRRDRWIVLAAVVGYAAALAGTHEVWHRYVEPFVLIVLTLVAARVVGRDGVGRGGRVGGGRWGACVEWGGWGSVAVSAVGVGLGALTCVTVSRGKPVRDLGLYEVPAFRVEGWSMPRGVVREGE
ncbi:MAG: hypothetical protein KF705_00420 [Phycisphaeraceae bacterium]|nr:hypothetical protein [Phycisphaeraceae bacterium]